MLGETQTSFSDWRRPRAPRAPPPRPQQVRGVGGGPESVRAPVGRRQHVLYRSPGAGWRTIGHAPGRPEGRGLVRVDMEGDAMA